MSTAFLKAPELKFVEGGKNCISSLEETWKYDLLIATMHVYSNSYHECLQWGFENIYLITQYLLLLMGMNEAHSTYACLWCTVSSHDRYRNWNMGNLAFMSIHH